MSDFLTSLVARQLGNAPAVRPRLTARFEPPPDAFADDRPHAAPTQDASEDEPREIFFEELTRPARAHDAAPPRADGEYTNSRAQRLEFPETPTRPDTDNDSLRARVNHADEVETPARRVSDDGPRAEERREKSPELRPANVAPRPAESPRADSERTAARRDERDDAREPQTREQDSPRIESARRDVPTALTPQDDASARTRERRDDDEHEDSHPQRTARARDEDETTRPAPQSTLVVHTHVEPRDEAARPVTPAPQTPPPPPFSGDTRARVEPSAPAPQEPRKSSRADGDERARAAEAPRPASEIRPAATQPPARREPLDASRVADERPRVNRKESAKDAEPARANVPAHATPRARDEAKPDLKPAPRGRAKTETDEPRPAPRVRRAPPQPEQPPPTPTHSRRHAAPAEAAQARPESVPTINVTIGRVEVRATQAQPAAPARSAASRPRTSLDDYLRRRSGEVRE